MDGLRAIAVLAVVAFHAFPNWLKGGFIGVDIFFVISGFLISTIIISSLERGSFSFVEFYARRIKRIFPALLLVLAACFVFGWFALLADEYKQLGKHIAGGAGFVANFMFWQESGYFDNAADTKPLLHLWSLGIEEQFYIVWPLLLWLAWKRKFNLLTITLVVALISFALNIRTVHSDAVAAFYSPQTRFWELLAGSVLAQMKLHRTKLLPSLQHRLDAWLGQIIYTPAPEVNGKTLRNMQSLLGIALIVIGFIVVNKERHFPGGWAVLPVLGAVLIITAGAQAWLNRVVLSNRVLVWFGLISFPLYLWHWPLLSFARIIESETPTRGIRLAAVALAILLAWLTYRLIEKPLRFGKQGRAKTIVLLVLMGVVGFAGYNAYKRDGLGFRNKLLDQKNAQFAWGDNNLFNELCRAAHKTNTTLDSADFCLTSKDVSPTIALLGESHANHLYPGMAEMLHNTSDSVINLGRGGCVPFESVNSSSIGQPNLCSGITADAIRFAERSDAVHTVIIGMRGPLYLYGKGFGAIDPENRTLSLLGRPALGSFPEILKIGMRDTLQRLLAKQKKIIFVLDNPELGFHPQVCVDSRPLRLSSKIKTPCAVSRKEFDERNREYRELVFSVLKDFPSVQIFDAAAQLCDDKWCWAMKDGKMLYRDDDHLSIEGSRYIAQGLTTLIAQ
ncbi:MAG: acyltransferase family protein [Gallionella sp.]